VADVELLPCGECGMPCRAGEYHPFAACLMFKACHNSETVRANLAPLQAENERLRAEVEEMQRRLDREESDHGRTIDQRDAAEDALGRMFQAVTGRTAEWSSAWGYVDAIEEVEEHVATLATERDQLAAALEAGRRNAGVLVPPEGYALVSVEALRAWGKLDEVRECCRYLKHATPQPAHVDDEALRDAAMANERTRRCET